MAQMIPESIPSGRPKGERDVFDILQELPDDYLVYYEPIIKNRYPDFVVVCPDLGLMVIEVKDWLVNNIIEANNAFVTLLSVGGETTKAKHPRKQAREYQFTLMNRFHGNPAFDIIKHPHGDHAGQFLFPFGNMAVLSKITFEQLRERNLTAVFPEEGVLTKDALEKWKGLKGEFLAEQIKSFFDPYWPLTCGKLDQKQVDLVRATIHPDIIVRHGDASETTDRLLVLDKKQEIQAKKILDGHRIINGVAGAGKTVLLLHRARWLGKADPSKRIAVLCFNKMLAAYLRDAISDVSNVEVLHFHKWGMSLGAKFHKDRKQFGENVMKLVQKMKSEQKYDAILIDEAQDFDPEWLRCCVQALQDPEEGDLIAVADGNQGLYKPVSFTWKSVGIKATGRVIPLKQAYRNTEQILHLARPFAEDKADSGENIVPMKPGAALINGPLPMLHCAQHRAAEMDRVTEILSNLLQAKWGEKDLKKPLKPSEIGVVYARKTSKVEPHFFKFLRTLPNKLNVPVVWLSDPAHDGEIDLINKEGIRIQTIQSSKGLQYKAVVLMWADQLPMNKHDETSVAEDKRMLYVALTRAERYLAVTYTGKYSNFTKRLEEEAISNTPIVFFCEYCNYHSPDISDPGLSGKSAFQKECPNCSKVSEISLL
jgi:hypothetical protein